MLVLYRVGYDRADHKSSCWLCVYVACLSVFVVLVACVNSDTEVLIRVLCLDGSSHCLHFSCSSQTPPSKHWRLWTVKAQVQWSSFCRRYRCEKCGQLCHDCAENEC